MSMPDFSAHGYSITRMLGSSPEGGRATYLAHRHADRSLVVVKVFHFGLVSSSWSGYKAYEREIEVLRQLDHPRIPRFLDSFPIDAGFCLVQEYKNAPSLAGRRPFSLDQIKKIALSVLEILVYLQRHRPPIFHRDLKPENILLDQQLNAYLIDFGLARVRGGSVALTSMAAGTLGFMPPEELYNRSLTRASDLYSLGATLLCLATRTPSHRIGTLVDRSFQLKVAGRIPGASRAFVTWLGKMVALNPDDRFASADLASQALHSIPVKPSSIPGSNALLSLRWASLGALPLVLVMIASSRAVSDFKTQAPSDPYTQIKSLLSTGRCSDDQIIGCDLRNLDLEGIYLPGVDLAGAILSKTSLAHGHLQQANLSRAELGESHWVHADLTEANLTGANLVKANMRDARLNSADLSWASIQQGDLRHANLRQAILANVNGTGADLRGTNLSDANLKQALLPEANLSRSLLAGANLESAVLRHSLLIEADLRQVNLQNANLSGANLRGVVLRQGDLRGANLQKADLSRVAANEAQFQSADLQEAVLAGADLNRADLRGATLRYADLRGADLRFANLEETDLNGADLWGALLEGATLPDGSTYP